jgi:Trypsin
MDVRHYHSQDLTTHKNIRLINNDCGSTAAGDRVMNGKDAALFEFPWIVLLGFKDLINNRMAHICGGSLISEMFVLTG